MSLTSISKLTMTMTLMTTSTMMNEDDEEYYWNSPYFITMRELQLAIRLDRFDDAVPLVRQNLEQLAERLSDGKYRDMDYCSVIEQGGYVLALKGQGADLERMREIVANNSALDIYSEDVDRQFDNMTLFEEIRSAIRDNPGCVQSEMKVLINVVDGRLVARLIQWLERDREIVRKRQGRKILLYSS